MSEAKSARRALTDAELLQAIEKRPLSAAIKKQFAGIEEAGRRIEKLRTKFRPPRFQLPSLFAASPRAEIVTAPDESLLTSLRRAAEVRQDVAHVAEGFIDRLADAVVRRQEAGAAQPPNPASEPQGPAFYSTKEVWKRLAEAGYSTTPNAIQKWPTYARKHQPRCWVRHGIGLAHQKGSGFVAVVVDHVCREFRAQVKSMAKRLKVSEREAQDVVRAES